jgi:hypothetical protein
MYLVYVTGKRIDYDVSHTSHNMHKTRCKMNSQSLWDRMEPLLLVGRIVVSLVAGRSRYLRKVDSQDQHYVELLSCAMAAICIRVIIIISTLPHARATAL